MAALHTPRSGHPTPRARLERRRGRRDPGGVSPVASPYRHIARRDGVARIHRYPHGSGDEMADEAAPHPALVRRVGQRRAFRGCYTATRRRTARDAPSRLLDPQSVQARRPRDLRSAPERAVESARDRRGGRALARDGETSSESYLLPCALLDRTGSGAHGLHVTGRSGAGWVPQTICIVFWIFDPPIRMEFMRRATVIAMLVAGCAPAARVSLDRNGAGGHANDGGVAGWGATGGSPGVGMGGSRTDASSDIGFDSQQPADTGDSRTGTGDADSREVGSSTVIPPTGPQTCGTHWSNPVSTGAHDPSLVKEGDTYYVF